MGRKRDRVLVKFVRCQADCVKDSMHRAGWRQSDKGEEDWDVAWADTTAALFHSIQYLKPFQSVNHFPLMQLICRKDLLAQHLQAMPQFCPAFAESFRFVPQTWVLPGDQQRFWSDVRKTFERSQDLATPKVRGHASLRKSTTAWSRGTSADATGSDESEDEDEAMTFIAKPRSGARGVGIFLFQVRPADLTAPQTAALRRVLEPSSKFVVQKFLTKPLLIDGYKWDMRVYVLVTSMRPLTVYLYTDGLARFCTDPYEPPDKENLCDREMHLTNFSINYESDSFEDTEDGATGSKRSLRVVLDSCVEDGDAVWTEIAACVSKTLLAILPKMEENYDRYFGRMRGGAADARSACFEILGFDFILDEDERLYLLEVNSAPSLSTPTTLDEEIKSSMLGEAFRLLHMDGSAKVRHKHMAHQRLVGRQQEHVARREELSKQREERLKHSVGFLSTLGQRKLPPLFGGRPDLVNKVRAADAETVRPGGDVEIEALSSLPTCANLALDSDGDETEEEDSDASSSDDGGWDEYDDDFAFLGTPVSRNYVQILPAAEQEKDALWQEIRAGAEKLAQGWNVRRPNSQPPQSPPVDASPPARSPPMRSGPSTPRLAMNRASKRAATAPVSTFPKPQKKDVREVFPLKTVQIGLPTAVVPISR
mmetsp:Transcript_4646/g.10920  ORF Transcript_4646/g.10920 Transcript_4646/m.10920 type:complete len:652 (+) Transcript_4646:19-1974(+)